MLQGAPPFPIGKGEVPASHPLPLSHSWLGAAPQSSAQPAGYVGWDLPRPFFDFAKQGRRTQLPGAQKAALDPLGVGKPWEGGTGRSCWRAALGCLLLGSSGPAGIPAPPWRNPEGSFLLWPGEIIQVIANIYQGCALGLVFGE